jgi:hypothetical protein
VERYPESAFRLQHPLYLPQSVRNVGVGKRNACDHKIELSIGEWQMLSAPGGKPYVGGNPALPKSHCTFVHIDTKALQFGIRHGKCLSRSAPYVKDASTRRDGGWKDVGRVTRILSDSQLAKVIRLAQTLVNFQRHVHNVETKALRWKARDRTRRHVEPGLISRLGNAVIEIKQKLVGAAANRRHLPKC